VDTVFVSSLHSSLMYIDHHRQTKLKHKIEAESESPYKLSIDSCPLDLLDSVE